MKRLIPYIAFAFLTGLTSTRGLPVMSGSCSNHMNKTAEIICDEDDTECKTEKDEKIELSKTARS